jgi:hypothetical protein
VASKPGPSGGDAHDSHIHFHAGREIALAHGCEIDAVQRQRVSTESFLRTARHHTGAVFDKSVIVDQSEKSRVKTTLAWRWPSQNSVPHFIQFSAPRRTMSPA